MAIFVVPSHVLESFARLAETPPREPSDTSELLRSIASSGSADWHEIETLVRDLDPRGLPYGRTMADWPPLFGFPYVPMAFRPRSSEDGAGLFDRLPAARLAAFLCLMERLGLPIDPGPLVDALLPGIRAKAFVDENDLDVLWYRKARHKGDGDLLRSDEPFEGETTTVSHVSKARYGIVVERQGGRVVSVQVCQPRRPRWIELIPAMCPECLTPYTIGDQDSVRHHRQEHSRFTPAFSPGVDARFAALPTGPDRAWVRWNSPAWMQRAVYLRASLFKREEGYDFVQWAERGEDDPDVVGYLFEDDTGSFPPATIVGATCFRKIHGRWAMDWIWLCREARRKGILTRRWEAFRDRFGDFGLTAPLSKDMEAFVSLRSPHSQLV